jgi:hypothetical protein
MKYLIVAISALALTACKENQGVHKGTFEADCAAKNGTLAQVAPNEYTCTLPDGTVLKTADKKETGASK